MSKEDIRQIIETSNSYAQVARKMGYGDVISGAVYRTIHKIIDELELDISHFSGQSWSKNKVDISKYKYGTPLNSGQALRDLSILRSRRCEQCGLTKWNEQEIPLEVHHKDGNYLNSELSNLVLLCRNCHALTENFGSKNRRKKVDDETLIEALRTTNNVRQALIKVGLTAKGENYNRCYDLIHKYNIIQLNKENTREIKRCKRCGRPIATSTAKLCRDCAHEIQRVCERPSREELKRKVYTRPFLQIGKEYNVSDSAIRKWCTYYSIPYKKKDIKRFTYDEWERL